ncbi:glutathione peroxidase [Aquirufa antheringensis]|uniref:glutathione peroxidase n=1 Tax=Aquirufa antheringensis TaxID=2516559 RepID=UPI001F452BE6|nr:glutathione peroxidase [Aquirufa antheringensis]MCL9968961.1 glutathione peroxidase [Aquirufa antheringensis]
MIASFMKIGSLLTALALPFTQKTVLNRPEKMENPAATTNFHSFKMKGIDGKEIDFSQFKGKKIIVLNTASKCGYTPQYADWEKFHKENKDIVILGFPANEFGGQEPGSNAEISSFCSLNYGVSFQMMEKVVVKGSEKCELYQWLSDKSKNGWNEKEPSWNFCKYVINEKGELQNFFASGIKPNSPEFLAAIGK